MRKLSSYILLIDDDPDDLDMFSNGLSKNGMKVVSFDSSAKALFYLTLMSGNKDLPSLIILDYNMPRNNGHQVLSQIKNNADTKHIPVVIYSTSISGNLKKKLSDSGAYDSFDKPWTYKEFTDQVDVFHTIANSIN